MAKGPNAFGIKEVADVKFYPIAATASEQVFLASATYNSSTGDITYNWVNAEGSAGAQASAVYSFDSLKVSNIEVASEDVSARGGKGNPELITWSYGKTASLALTDALISMDTLDLMFGAKEASDEDSKIITIDGASFPVPYSIVGTTAMRNYSTGVDEPFIFYIPKGQVQVGGTLTMEAEGDPTTFEMNVKALAQNIGNDKDVLVRFIRCTPGT